MAKLEDIKQLYRDLNIEFSPDAAGAIAGSTPNEFNYDWVLKELQLKEGKVTATAIKNAILKCKPEKAQHCGHCRLTWVPVLDRKEWHRQGCPEFQYFVFIPKADVPCPNCSTQKDRMQTVLDSMTADELGWTYCILYDFAVKIGETLDPIPPRLTPDQFDPAQLWGIDINPLLTEAMRSMIQWIYKPYVVPIPQPERMRSRVRSFTRPLIPESLKQEVS